MVERRQAGKAQHAARNIVWSNYARHTGATITCRTSAAIHTKKKKKILKIKITISFQREELLNTTQSLTLLDIWNTTCFTYTNHAHTCLQMHFNMYTLWLFNFVCTCIFITLNHMSVRAHPCIYSHACTYKNDSVQQLRSNRT